MLADKFFLWTAFTPLKFRYSLVGVSYLTAFLSKHYTSRVYLLITKYNNQDVEFGRKSSQCPYLIHYKKNTFSNKKPVFYSGQNAKIDKKKYLNKMIKCYELLVPPLLAIWNFGPQQPNPNPLPKKKTSLISKTPFLSL